MSNRPPDSLFTANNPNIDFALLEEQLKAALKRENGLVEPVAFRVDDIACQIDETVPAAPAYIFETDPECFVTKVYRFYFQRIPDPQANRIWLKRIRCGWPKALLPLRIRFSPEGRARGIRLKGHRRWILTNLLRAVPLFGRIVLIIRTLWALPDWYAESRYEKQRLRYLEDRYDLSRRLLRKVNSNLLELEQAICSLESEQRLECVRRHRSLRRRLKELEKVIGLPSAAGQVPGRDEQVE